MHIPDCSKDSVEIEYGGNANISQGTHEGRRVAIKIVRVYITSDLDVIFSVSVALAPLYLSRGLCYRDSAERGLPGSTSDIQISYHCLG